MNVNKLLLSVLLRGYLIHICTLFTQDTEGKLHQQLH